MGGEKLLPTIPIDFSISAFLLTILIICLLAFIGSFLYLYKILGNAVLLGDRFDSKNHFVVKIIKVLGFAISLGFWLKLLIPFFTVSVNKPNENLLFRLDDSILLILVMHLLLLAFISPHIQIFLTKILLAWRSSYDFVMAKWIILKDKEYLKSLTVSISVSYTHLKKLGCYKGNLEVKDRGEIEEIVRKLLEGLSLVKQEWENVSRSSHVFPVHYYGLNINQGIAYSDIGILMSYQKLLSLDVYKRQIIGPIVK